MKYVLAFLISIPTFAQDWSATSSLPGEPICEMIHGHEVCLTDQNRQNIYNLDESNLSEINYKGAKHVLSYPVTTTRMRLPKKAMDKFFEEDSRSPLRRFIFRVAQSLSSFKSMDDLFKWVGLHEFPKNENEIGPNLIADMGELEKYPMGVTSLERNGYEAFTFSCAACHSSDLFGVKVVGLQNRFPRANETFILGQKLLKQGSPTLFNILIGPSREDAATYKETHAAMKFVRLKKPLVLGLDTSLAQVGLSLEVRGKDEYAELKPPMRRRGRTRAKPNPLNDVPADSKPGVWWNLKYKTKWLLDGSIVSGNPVHTNFLWNEIGRGADLRKLEGWMQNNDRIIKELTAYVFNTEAPLFNDFFPNHIDIEMAKAGEKLFLKSCKGCHGVYEKGWSDPTLTNYEDKIRTTKIWYHKKTPVIDIGTDSYRAEGMKYFAKRLNDLKISKTMKTVVKPQKGYIPPPLVGVWARWPYFHNNSAPTLMDVISPAAKRPSKYIAVPAQDKRLDFDITKNGYPAPESVRTPWKTDPEYLYDTSIKGLSNSGHQKMLLDDSGQEKFTQQEKQQIIQFLQTL